MSTTTGLALRNGSLDKTGRIHDVHLIDRLSPRANLGESVGFVDTTIAKAGGIEDDGITSRSTGCIGGCDGIARGRWKDIVGANTKGEEFEGHSSESCGTGRAGGFLLEGVFP